MDLVVAYDISTVTRAGVRRLTEVARICEQYGVRVQKSVFEARLSAVQYERLVGDLLDVIHPEQDRVLLYRLIGDVAESRETLGKQTARDHGSPWIF